ncbi:MAG: 3-dehydroquinate synthase [Rhodospirillales bacterium]|nr:3-dehydroquinate synthase [Rhodospirillales bacterium]
MMEPREQAVAETGLRVDLASRSYDIVIGSGVLRELGGLVRPVLARPAAVVVTDTNVAPHYLGTALASLRAAGIAAGEVVMPAGEATKDFAHLETLCDRLLAAGVERTTTLIALGGGVIGDLTGFAAGIVLRGLAFIQVPTTLLAQVDSAVGGKTGINTPRGKNLIGLFYQPKLVVADSDTLATLDARQRRAGYAEVVKYGLIGDAAFFAWLERNGAAVCAGDAAACREAILTSCAAKARIVAADEREAGRRALLNLGHTFGHALEAEAGYGDALLHGEAVAIGMAMAFALSARLNLCAPEAAARVRSHLRSVGLPTALDDLEPRPVWSAAALARHMDHDKKVEGGRPRFVLASDIGAAFVSDAVPAADLISILRQFGAA